MEVSWRWLYQICHACVRLDVLETGGFLIQLALHLQNVLGPLGRGPWPSLQGTDLVGGVMDLHDEVYAGLPHVDVYAGGIGCKGGSGDVGRALEGQFAVCGQQP